MRRTHAHRFGATILGWLLLATFALGQAPAAPATKAPSSVRAAEARLPHEKPPTELYEIEKVVDGDTLWIKRAGKTEKLRLLAVDTEERMGPGHVSTPLKPVTVFGEETALWAIDFFGSLGKEGSKPQVGLVFPDGVEHRDVYGRLLCHVLIPDGTDYDLLIVRLGKSPYFNKYGNDELCHAAFVAAQNEARTKKLGIWDPKTNVAKSADAPSVVRPYAELMPWWEARAVAIDGFRKQKSEKPESLFHAEDKDGLAHAAKLGTEVEVFGEVEKPFDESNGDLKVLMRGVDSAHKLRVRIAQAARAAHASLDFSALTAEFHQNYVYVRGQVRETGRGFELSSDSAARWRKAGPEPAPVTTPTPSVAK
jgi:endonuclease YncB( thermonuclease family)